MTLHIHPNDQYQHADGMIHALDPRIKVACTLTFILAVSLVPEGAWWAFGALLGLIALLEWRAGLKISLVLRRSIVVLPFVLAALALPFTMPGEPLLKLPGLGWTLSVEGTVRAGSILVRALLAIQAAILLGATTPFRDIAWALEAMRVPSALVAIAAFGYRYLYLLTDESLRMMRARQSRSGTAQRASLSALRWRMRSTGAMVGVLFLRAVERSDRIYAAMASRGYDGHSRFSAERRLSPAELTFLILSLILTMSPVVLAALI